MLGKLLFVTFLANTLAQTCKKPLLGCVKTGNNHLCPDGSVCFVNKTDDDKSFCCNITDIDNNGNTNNPGTKVTTSRPATTTSCVDKKNPATGVSDCPARQYLCNDATYYTLMTDQCPKTCGRCSGNNQNSNSGNKGTTCVDKINPATQQSDCPDRKDLCNNSIYYTFMTEECPKTCERCTTTSNANTNTNTNNGGTNCNDASLNCPSWVKNGYCTNTFYSDATKKQNCARSCNLC